MFGRKTEVIEALTLELKGEMIRADAMEKMRDTARRAVEAASNMMKDAENKILGLQAERDQFAKRVEDLLEEAKELRERIQQSNSVETSPDRREVLDDHLPDQVENRFDDSSER